MTTLYQVRKNSRWLHIGWSVNLLTTSNVISRPHVPQHEKFTNNLGRDEVLYSFLFTLCGSTGPFPNCIQEGRGRLLLSRWMQTIMGTMSRPQRREQRSSYLFDRKQFASTLHLRRYFNLWQCWFKSVINIIVMNFIVVVIIIII